MMRVSRAEPQGEQPQVNSSRPGILGVFDREACKLVFPVRLQALLPAPRRCDTRHGCTRPSAALSPVRCSSRQHGWQGSCSLLTHKEDEGEAGQG